MSRKSNNVGGEPFGSASDRSQPFASNPHLHPSTNTNSLRRIRHFFGLPQCEGKSADPPIGHLPPCHPPSTCLNLSCQKFLFGPHRPGINTRPQQSSSMLNWITEFDAWLNRSEVNACRSCHLFSPPRHRPCLQPPFWSRTHALCSKWPTPLEVHSPDLSLRPLTQNLRRRGGATLGGMGRGLAQATESMECVGTMVGHPTFPLESVSSL